VHSDTDEQLMRRVRDGEVATLGLLYERHRTPLFNFFLRLTNNAASREDLVHEVFLRMLKYRHTFNAEHRLTTWMYQMARNTHFDFRHKRRHESPMNTETLEEQGALPSLEVPPDMQTGKDQELQLLQAALVGLSDESREALVLSRFQNLKYEEIAIVLNCGVGAVKMRVHRALKELRARFTSLAGKELK
jgi:RNA polymerase sigma factor (sigma-70 family)